MICILRSWVNIWQRWLAGPPYVELWEPLNLNDIQVLDRRHHNSLDSHANNASLGLKNRQSGCNFLLQANFKRQHSCWFQNLSATCSSNPPSRVIPLPIAKYLNFLASDGSKGGVEKPFSSAFQAAAFSLTSESVYHPSSSPPTLIILLFSRFACK